MSVVITTPLQKCLPSLTSGVTEQYWEEIAVHFVIQRQNETLDLIARLSQNIQILNQQKDKATALISILEEAGGMTVRARKLMTTEEDVLEYEPQIKEFEDKFNLARTRFDKTSLNSSTNGINLMNGDLLETFFDTKGQNKLVTEGIILSCDALGIRPADFSTSPTLQNARIDVMNAIDIAVTVRNTITSHIAHLTINLDFAVEAIEVAKAASAKLGASNLESESLALKKLEEMGDRILGEEKLAAPTQQEILNSFASSFAGPNMEDI